MCLSLKYHTPVVAADCDESRFVCEHCENRAQKGRGEWTMAVSDDL